MTRKNAPRLKRCHFWRNLDLSSKGPYISVRSLPLASHRVEKNPDVALA